LELSIVTLGNASPGAHQVGEVLVRKVINDLMGVERANRFDWKKENLVRGNWRQETCWLNESLLRGLGVRDGPVVVRREKCEDIFEHPAYAR
jgi:hypothetical protein